MSQNPANQPPGNPAPRLKPSDLLAELDATRAPRPALDVAFVAPETETQKIVAACWAEVLLLQSVGITDNFFSLGGDSLQMTQIGSRIREKTGAELSFNDFFEFPTVEGLSKLIAAAGPRT